jgi:hypothetical protein
METERLLSFAFLVFCCCLHSLHSAPPSRHPRQVSQDEASVFQLGKCQDCQKLLVRDNVARCPASNSDQSVNTILSYDSFECHADEQIACVKVTDCSPTRDGAIVAIKSGNIGEPFIRLNITSHPGKGYRLRVEIRGINRLDPECK